MNIAELPFFEEQEGDDGIATTIMNRLAARSGEPLATARAIRSMSRRPLFQRSDDKVPCAFARLIQEGRFDADAGDVTGVLREAAKMLHRDGNHSPYVARCPATGAYLNAEPINE